MSTVTSTINILDATSSKVQADYQKIRLSAKFGQFWSRVTGKSSKLISFSEFKSSLRIETPTYRGTQPVNINQINGSLDRNQDFDQNFRPTNDYTAERWKSVNRAFYKGVYLPPVILYKIKDTFFVVDGHHRISVAKYHNQIYIDSEVYDYLEGKNIENKPDSTLMSIHGY